MLRGPAGIRQSLRRDGRELVVSDAARQLRPRPWEPCGIEPGRGRIARARDVRAAFEAAERAGRDAVVVGDDDVRRRRNDRRFLSDLSEAPRRNHNNRSRHPEALGHLSSRVQQEFRHCNRESSRYRCCGLSRPHGCPARIIQTAWDSPSALALASTKSSPRSAKAGWARCIGHRHKAES